MGAPRFLVQFVWDLTATRSWPERLSWMVWLWAAVLYSMWRTATPGAAPGATRGGARRGAAVRETP
jgi:hypothetical protein